MVRDHETEIQLKYIGMIPCSLELNKLISIGLKTRKSKTNKKLLSDDVINLKFRQKVKSGDEILKHIHKKFQVLPESEGDSENTDDKPNQKKIEYKNKLKKLELLLENEKEEDKWNEVKNEDLRKILYSNGLVLNGQKYVVYKRSTAKSRIGQCLFIKESLYNEMISWSRMRLKLDGVDTDFPSLLAYESLVGSSLERIITIDPKNILIVDDVESKFSQVCNVVRKGVDGYLDSFCEEAELNNSLFDGESLLDSSYFSEGKSMMLLRNHMFKSAAFNTNIQKYLKDNCPKNINYEKWEIENMFGQRILAKDVHLIITPSSLKALKFSHVFEGEDLGKQGIEMWEHWKKVIETEGNSFGVCKSEKKSKHGYDTEGKVLQQMSYQMVNSLPLKLTDIEDLVSFELEYIEKLKNDDDFFIQHIRKSANTMNSNNMFVDLYERNRDIVHTKVFRRFRTEENSSHIKKVKRGKIRIPKSDYLVMLGNPMEFLQHAIGKLDLSKPALRENEVYTTLFEFNQELIGFRNPHTSPSNVLIAKNTYDKEIDTYFNLSDNIVCVNAIDFPIQDILSGCDYDSDTMLMSNYKQLLSIGKQVFGKYKVCINKVASSKKKYRLNNLDMSEIDNQLSKSQRQIGEVVNLGQLCMSTYWDLLEQGETEDNLKELLKKIDVMTVLSGICIDLAKKMFDIKIKSEIENVRKTKQLKDKKPLFWEYVSQNKDVKTERYHCPMDYLDEVMSGIKYAEQKKNINLKDLLVKCNLKDGDRKQQAKIIDYVTNMCDKINTVYASGDIEKEEKDKISESIIQYYEFYIGKLKLSPSTMYALLLKISDHKNDKIARKMMNILHMAKFETYINAFKIKNSTC